MAEDQPLGTPRAGLTQPNPSVVKEPAPAQPKTPKVEEPASPPPAARPEVPAWVLQVRTLDLLEVAEVLGLHVEDNRLLPCPRCGVEVGAQLYRNKKGWVLWRCGACKAWDRGNLDLVSYALAGEKAGDLPRDEKILLRQWFSDQGWCDAAGDGEDGDGVR